MCASNDDNCRRIQDTVDFLAVCRYFTYYEIQRLGSACLLLKFLGLLLSFYIVIDKS